MIHLLDKALLSHKIMKFFQSKTFSKNQIKLDITQQIISFRNPQEGEMQKINLALKMY